MSSRPRSRVLPILNIQSAAYDWKSLSSLDPYFGLIITSLQRPTVVDQTSFLDYTLQDGFLYRSNPLCVPAGSGRLTLLKEAHSSSYGGHFGTSRMRKHGSTERRERMCKHGSTNAPHPISIKEDREILIGLPCGGMWKISFEDVLHAINLSLPTISLVYTSHFQFPLGLGNLCCCM